MSHHRDLTGMRFGRLNVVERAEDAYRKNGKPRQRWLCRCDCGKEKIVYGENLTGGKTLSCGCLQKEKASSANSTHRSTNTKLYGVWCAMKQRCYNTNSTEYRLYGGRGISVCDEWRFDFKKFQSWALKNGYKESLSRGEQTIDRIDVNGDYCPENCRFVSQQEQMNNVRYNHFETVNGERHTVAEWARLYNIPYSKLYQRITRYGYTMEQALGLTTGKL